MSFARAMGSGFQLIAGERRLRASQLAGLETISAIVREASEEEMLEWSLVENIHRADLNAVERGRAYQQYMSRFSLTQEQAADRLGDDRSTIANYVRLLELSSELQEMVIVGQLSMGHARALLSRTRCSVIEAVVSESCIPRSPRCRHVRSSKPRAM